MGQVWAAAVVVAVVVLLWAERTKNGPVRVISKTIGSTCFLGAALAWGATTSLYGHLLFIAMALCWLGDVLLLSRKDKVFLGGLFAFLLGHVGYGVAFVRLGIDPVGAAFGAAAVLILLPLVARWLLPHVKGSMKGPVIAYMVVISAMVALAVGCTLATGRPVFLIAAVLFFISDLAVARDRFVQPGYPNKRWGLPLYYGAQVLFAWTAA